MSTIPGRRFGSENRKKGIGMVKWRQKGKLEMMNAKMTSSRDLRISSILSFIVGCAALVGAAMECSSFGQDLQSTSYFYGWDQICLLGTDAIIALIFAIVGVALMIAWSADGRAAKAKQAAQHA